MTANDIELLAEAIDRLIAGAPAAPDEVPGTLPRRLLQVASFLNESFPRLTAPAAARARVRQRVLGGAPWQSMPISLPPYLEHWAERLPLTRRRVIGAAAVLTFCLLGYAYLRQRSAIHRLAAAPMPQ